MSGARSAPASDLAAARAPRVAVIVPAYGVAHLLGEALASLQAQTMAAWECVVIDDGAPDDVAAAVAPYLADTRITFLATANHGVSAARNRAIAATSAPLVTLLDGDDLLRPEYLDTVLPLLERDPAIRLVTCNARMFGAVAQETTCFAPGHAARGTLAGVLDRSFGVYIGSTFRRADFDAVSGFDPAMTHAEDLDLWVRLLQLGGHAHYIDRELGDYRVRAGSASGHGLRMLRGNLRVCEKALASLPAAAPEVPLLHRLIAEHEQAVAFEVAIDAIIAGDTARGLAALRSSGAQVGGPVWAASFALWRVVPALAPPMLRWRRRAHTRGNVGRTIPAPRRRSA